MMGIGGARPAGGAGSGVAAWEDVADLFDLDGSEEVEFAGFSGIEPGSEYRLSFQSVKTTAPDEFGEHSIHLQLSTLSESLDILTLAFFPDYSGDLGKVHGIVDLHNVGRESDCFFARNSLVLGVQGGSISMRHSPSYYLASPGHIDSVSILTYPGSYLMGRCVLQRRRTSA